MRKINSVVNGVDPRPEDKPKKIRVKKRSVPSGTNKIEFYADQTEKTRKLLTKVKGFRESGMRISDIAELLNLDEKVILIEIRRYKSEG